MGGGIFIAIKDCTQMNTDGKCKIVLTQVHLEQAKYMYMGAAVSDTTDKLNTK